MRKTKLALTALMIGALTVTGASLAEAKLKVDDVKIIIGARDDQRLPGGRGDTPPAPDMRDGHRPPAPRPPEAHRPDGHGGPGQDHRGPAPRPADERGPRFDKPHGSKPHDPHKPGHDVPPPPPHGGHR